MNINRWLFLLISGVGGFFLFNTIGMDWINVLGLVAGVVIATFVLFIEHLLKKVETRVILWGFLGFLVGIFTAWIIIALTDSLFMTGALLSVSWRPFVILTCAYLGLVLGVRFGRELVSMGVQKFFHENPMGPNNKVLDTSVIIDGRIADLCETGFIEGTFVIPHFILNELQHIADSSDSLKRARGRRGLDILNRIQKMSGIDVKIIDDDFPSIREVDSKLVALAKKLSAKIVTNDLNLNKVAELQGLEVLNINELCNALKPVVLPGESMRVFVLKEGKEAGQGVAYLDDGTMIVVDEAKRCIGRNVDVVVTSVLQTTAGRMIFTRMRDRDEPERERVETPVGK